MVDFWHCPYGGCFSGTLASACRGVFHSGGSARVDSWHSRNAGFAGGERCARWRPRAVVSLAPEVGKWWDFGLAVVWRPRAVVSLAPEESAHAGDR